MRVTENKTNGEIGEPIQFFRADANVREYRRLATPILRDLEQAGILVEEIGDVTKLKSKEYKQALPILLHWLERADTDRMLEEIVRALRNKVARPAAAAPLIRAFASRDDPLSVMWVIGDTLSVVADDSVYDDMARLARDRRYGRGREMLVVGLGNMTRPEAVDLLVELLDDEDVAGHAIIALGKLGPPSARERVAQFLVHKKAWVRREAKKTIARIDKGQNAAAQSSTEP